MFQDFKGTVLALAPHPDDIEFGCGGTLARLIQQGATVWSVAFANCQKSLPAAAPENQLFDEFRKASQILGIASDRVMTKNYEVRDFPRDRQLILEDLIKLRHTIKPDLVLCPNSDDVHQDHGVIYHESKRAFKASSILGYELPWNNSRFPGNVWIGLTEEHLKVKLEAIQAYQSQGFRPYHNDDFFRGLARIRGMQAGHALAEAFEAIRISA